MRTYRCACCYVWLVDDPLFVFLPSGPAGSLLVAALEAGTSESFAELGRRAGLSRFAAARAGADLVAAEWLTSTDRGYRYNPFHPLARVAEWTLWQLVGAERPGAAPHPLGQAELQHIATFVPPSLRRFTMPGLAGRLAVAPPGLPSVTGGPEAVHVRGWLERATELAVTWAEVQSITQSVTHPGGPADLDRLSWFLGTPTRQATVDLFSTVSGVRDPLTSVELLPWARSVYLVAADIDHAETVAAKFSGPGPPPAALQLRGVAATARLVLDDMMGHPAWDWWLGMRTPEDIPYTPRPNLP